MSGSVDVLGRLRAEIAVADKRIAETTDSLQAMYAEGRARSQAVHDALSELMVAGADYLHCESCAYDAVAMVAVRNRFRAALANVSASGVKS